MANAVTPVSIVTTDGPAGRFGMTVSAVTSLSAEPPMVLACINRKSPALDAIKDCDNHVFFINMLSKHQSDPANCFAGRPDYGESHDFSIAEWRELVTGSPTLKNAATIFDCALEAALDAGTHSIILGNVMEVQNSNQSPSIYVSHISGIASDTKPTRQGQIGK